MRIHETCSCGAEIEIGDSWKGPAVGTVEDWRRNHRHDAPEIREGAPEQRGVSVAQVEFGFVPDHERPIEVTA